MTSPLGLSAVFAYLMVVLVLVGAVAYRRLSELARLVIATFAFACAWLMTGALDAMRGPDWTMVVGGAVVAVSILAVSATLHLWTQAGDAGEDNPRYRGDDGEGGLRRHRPDSPQPGGGGSDPNWWPEFERRLALYVAERETEKRSADVVAEVSDGVRAATRG